MSPERAGRSAAEWITFVVALAVVGLVVVLVAVEIPGSKSPALPTVHAAEAVRRGDGFVVEVEVENLGQRTAQNVEVEAAVTVDGERRTSVQTVDFLAGQATEDLAFFFDEDPSDDDLEVRVTGFLPS